MIAGKPTIRIKSIQKKVTMSDQINRDVVLLSTKLKIPAPRKNYIVRKQLFQQLLSCQEMRVIYIMGAAGMGKTTLLSSFIKEQELQDVAWLSLDESNNQSFSFWHYFFAAISKFIGDEESARFISILHANFDTVHVENLLAMVINQLCGDRHYYVVLDDVHELSHPHLITSLDFFIKAMPDNVHLFMLSRQQPLVYVGELAASGELLFIDGDELLFSHEEGQAFLTNTLQLKISDEDIQQMNQLAEGWIGGLQLVAAAGHESRSLLSFSDHGVTATYLTREIFRKLTETEQHFLVTTCILTYFDEELSVELSGEINFLSTVNGLIEKNLFVTCVDEESAIYRYHPMLREYLLSQFTRLPRNEQISLHQLASSILASRRDYGEALQHLFVIEDYSAAMSLLKQMEETVETWTYINQIPLDILTGDLNLSLQCIIYNLTCLNMERCKHLCDALEVAYENEEVLLGLEYFFPYLEKNSQQYQPPTMLSLEQINRFELSPINKSLLLVASANILLSRNEYKLCSEFVNYAVNHNKGSNAFLDYYTLSSKTQLLEETGQLEQSLMMYKHIHNLLQTARIIDPLGYNYYIGLLGVLFKRMDKAQATVAINAVTEHVRRQAVVPKIVELSFQYHLVEYELLFGNEEKGISDANRVLNEVDMGNLYQFDRLLNHLHSIGKLDSKYSKLFIEQYRQQSEGEISLSSQLFYIRLLDHQGEHDHALQRVDYILAFSRENQNYLRLVEAAILKITMLVRQGEKAKRLIHNCLLEALHYARQNKILEPFFTDRATLYPLLVAYNANSLVNITLEERQFLQLVIEVCYVEKIQQSSGLQANKELLTNRELEVLMELAKGCTNAEIASHLFISVATVKTHMMNIFGKLEVSTRLGAVEMGRRRGWI